jgi:hypothetical protein
LAGFEVTAEDRRGQIYWISYPVAGEQVRESSHSTDRKAAASLLRSRQGEIANNRLWGALWG